MFELNICDELTDFINELIRLLKEDWKKFKLFIKQNKTYVYWFIALVFTLQFTDLMSLGSSWDRYCNKKNNMNKYIKDTDKEIQNGGAQSSTPTPVVAAAQAQGPTEKSPLRRLPQQQQQQQKQQQQQPRLPGFKGLVQKSKEQKQEKSDAKKAMHSEASSAGKDAASKALELGASSKQAKALGKQASKEALKTAKKQAKIDKTLDKKGGPFGRFGIGGPLSQSLPAIAENLTTIFSFLTFVLMFIGVISLPIFLFIIITYCAIKSLVGRFSNL